MRDDEVLVTASTQVDTIKFMPKAGHNNTAWGDAYAPVDKVVHIGGVMVGIPPSNLKSSRHAPRSTNS